MSSKGTSQVGNQSQQAGFLPGPSDLQDPHSLPEDLGSRGLPGLHKKVKKTNL